MPGGDGSGPWGTFRNCMPVDRQGNQITAQFYGRRFFGRGTGFYGRGFSRRFPAAGAYNWQASQEQAPVQPYKPTKQEKEEEISVLENELEEIKRRIIEIKKEV